MRLRKKVRESQIEKEVVAWAKAQAILAIKFTPMGEVGWPDRVFMAGGRSVFIEFKAPGKVARPLQAERIRVLVNNGFIAEVHDDTTSAIESLKRAFNI
jgi:hypothetical protein